MAQRRRQMAFPSVAVQIVHLARLADVQEVLEMVAAAAETPRLVLLLVVSDALGIASLDQAGRTRSEVAKAWVDRLVAAIRKHDDRHMITVGVIPWAHTFPKAKPLFYSEEVGENLDFASVHFYPNKGEVDKALAALRVYNVGKPLVVEEIFPLRCGLDELDAFVEGSRDFTDGWVGFYWGKTIAEYEQDDYGMAGALTKAWLEYFREKGPEILR